MWTIKYDFFVFQRTSVSLIIAASMFVCFFFQCNFVYYDNFAYF